MSRAAWDPSQLPDLSGRTYLVTGANAGLGFFAVEQLAAAGAHVILSGRNPNRLAAAHEAIDRRSGDAASVETLLLDTSNFGSVRAAAASVRSRGRLDGVLLNAGMVHAPSRREVTSDDHELVLATNLLGHFALAGALLTVLADTSAAAPPLPRMVWLGSMSTVLSHYDPVDPQLGERYSAWRAYVQSKAAVQAIGAEAERRLREEGVPVESVIAHPGYATSGRTPGIRGVNEPTRMTRFVDNLQVAITQSKQRGAHPLVRALVDPAVAGGETVGPRWLVRGGPRPGPGTKWTRDGELGARMWTFCEEATGVRWPFARARRAGRAAR